MSEQQLATVPAVVPPQQGAVDVGTTTSGPGNAAVRDRIQALRDAARGSWSGNVDEDQVLLLLMQLTPGEAAAVAADQVLLSTLGGALDAREISTAAMFLRMPLKNRAWWLQEAGEMGNVPDAAWTAAIAVSPLQELLAFVAWADVYAACLAEKPAATLGGLALALPALRLLVLVAAPELGDDEVAVRAGLLVQHGLFERLSSGLPRGSALSPGLRAAVLRLASAPSLDLARVRALFEVRFGKPVVDGETEEMEPVVWTADAVLQVWRTLDLLPDQDVSDSTILQVFQAARETGGSQEDFLVTIGIDASAEKLSHTVRHEIGHTVYDELGAQAESWLQKEAGMWTFSADATGYRQWIEEVGGFPSDYVDADGQSRAFGADQQALVVELLRTYGTHAKKEMQPGRATVPNDGNLEEEAIWTAMPAAVRDAVAASPGGWFKNYPNWHTGPRGKYFLNYYYGTPSYMGPTAEAVVRLTRPYAAMSHFELFADSYAEFFRDPAGYADPSKWGGALPAGVQGFFRAHVLERQPYTPPGGAVADVATTPATEGSLPSANAVRG